MSTASGCLCDTFSSESHGTANMLLHASVLTLLSTFFRETEPALTHPYDMPYHQSNSQMEVIRNLRLQVFTMSPTDDLPYTCFEIGTGPMQMCTAVISTSPQNSASVQLFMGGEAPSDAPYIECPKDAKDAGSLTVAVYQSDARIAHAIIPLSEVWEVRLSFYSICQPIAVLVVLPMYRTPWCRFTVFTCARMCPSKMFNGQSRVPALHVARTSVNNTVQHLSLSPLMLLCTSAYDPYLFLCMLSEFRASTCPSLTCPSSSA